MTTAAAKANTALPEACSALRLPWVIAAVCALAAVLWRIPFIFRYDLNFQTEYGQVYLMAKRILKGEFPIYFWGSDYGGTLPQFIAAAFFLVFGPSIELSAFVSVLAYAAAVGLGVWYVQKYFGAGQAVAAGLFGAVGVPYTLHYCAEPAGGAYVLAPLMAVTFLWLGALVYERGWNLWRCLAVGLFVGHCWYYSKQSLIGIATVGAVFIADARGRTLLKELLTSRYGLIFGAAFVVGYLPEIVFLLRPAEVRRHSLFGFASPDQMLSNLYWFVRVLPAYFDGDPLGRLPEGVHYLQFNPRTDSLPKSVADWLGIAIAWTVAVLIVRRLVQSWKRRNVAVLLLAAYPVFNALAVILSKVAVGEYYAPKRYLFSSGVILLLWAGIECWEFLKKRRWPGAVLIGLLLPMSTFHHIQMLRMPDELRDYRALVQQLRERGHRHGVTWYSYAFTLTALSDEQLIFGVLDYNQHEPYERIVRAQDELVLVFPTQRLEPPPYARFYDKPFHRVGPPNVVGELSWALYRRSG